MLYLTLLTAVCALSGSGRPVASASDANLFRGDTTNCAPLEREDPWWKQASDQVRFLQAAPATFRRSTLPVAIRQARTRNKVVALTFDDGPHPAGVRPLLETLDRYHVRATFFVVGKMAERHPELVKLEAEHGHEIGNHTFSHANLTQVEPSEAQTDYLACSNLIRRVVRHAPRFCRPPGGQEDAAVDNAGRLCGMTTVRWTDDPKDYTNPGASVILRRTLARLTPGGIILLHEGVHQTLEVMPQLIKAIRARGYSIVPLSQIARLSRPAMGGPARLTSHLRHELSLH